MGQPDQACWSVRASDAAARERFNTRKEADSRCIRIERQHKPPGCVRSSKAIRLVIGEERGGQPEPTAMVHSSDKRTRAQGLLLDLSEAPWRIPLWAHRLSSDWYAVPRGGNSSVSPEHQR